MKKWLTGLLIACMVIVMMPATAFATQSGHTHCDCGSSSCSGEGHDKSHEWTAWTDDDALPTTDGYYYLTKDVVIENDINGENAYLTKGADVHICLNGHVLSVNYWWVGDHPDFKYGGTSVVITDCTGNTNNNYYKYSTEEAWTWIQSPTSAQKTSAINPDQIDKDTKEGAVIKVAGGCLNLMQGAFQSFDNGQAVFNNITVIGGGGFTSRLGCSTINAQLDDEDNNVEYFEMNNCKVYGTSKMDYCISIDGDARLNNVTISHINDEVAAINVFNTKTRITEINNCVIRDNPCGGCVAEIGTATLQDCVITDNEGYGIKTDGMAGPMNLNNVTVENNKGGGIINAGDDKLMLSGKIVVQNNTLNDKEYNYYSEVKAYILSEGLTKGSFISVTPNVKMKSGFVIAEPEKSKDYTQYFHSERSDLFINLGSNYEVQIGSNRIIRQPSSDNNYTVAVTTSGLINPSVTYQWQKVAIENKDLSYICDKTAPQIIFMCSYDISKNEISSAKEVISEDDDVIMGMVNPPGSLGKGSELYFSCDKEVKLPKSEVEGDLGVLERIDATHYKLTIGATGYVALVADGYEAFTITDVYTPVLGDDYTDVDGQTTDRLTKYTDGYGYRCVVTVNDEEYTSIVCIPKNQEKSKIYDNVPVTPGMVRVLSQIDALDEINVFMAKIVNADEIEDIVSIEKNEKVRGVNIWVRVIDAANIMSNVEKSALEKAKENYKVGYYLDASLYKKVGDEDAVKISELNETIKISIVVPEDIRGKSDFAIATVHDGQTSVLKSEYDKSTSTITFETDSFSSYALLYKADEAEINTGDSNNILLYTALGIFALLGIAMMLLSRKRTE